MATTHDTVEACMDDEHYLPAGDEDTIVEESTGAEMHKQVVECPTCGRQYTYVFLNRGVFSDEQDDYVSPPDRFEEVDDGGYYDGQTFNVPLRPGQDDQAFDEGDLEIVYLLDRVEHDGEIVHEF